MRSSVYMTMTWTLPPQRISFAGFPVWCRYILVDTVANWSAYVTSLYSSFSYTLEPKKFAKVINMVESTADQFHPTTVLSLAADKHDHEMIKTLLDAGADQFADQNPDSCALRACFYGYHNLGSDEDFAPLVNCAKLLLDRGGRDHAAVREKLERFDWPAGLALEVAACVGTSTGSTPCRIIGRTRCKRDHGTDKAPFWFQYRKAGMAS